MSNIEYGYIKEDKIFRKGFREFPDKQIGEVKTDELSSITYFQERFLLAEKKVQDLENAVEAAENKGSYLMKLVHLKEYLVTIDAIGDFEPLYSRLENLEVELEKLIAENRANNLTLKNELIKEAETLKGSTNWKEDTDKFKDLKSRWIKTGNVEKIYEEEINYQFSSIVDDFFNKRQEYYETKHRVLQNKLFKLRQLLEKAKAAKDLPPFEARRDLRKLQDEWKRMGKIPGNLPKVLFKEFRAINDQVFQRRRDDSYTPAERSTSYARPRLSVEEMVKKAKELSNIKAPTKEEVEEVKTLQKNWKDMGPLPREQKYMAETFYAECNTVLEKNFIDTLANNRHKDFRALSEKEQLEIKVNLTQDLLVRDISELEIFQENLEKLNTNADVVNKMVNTKLRQQTRKVHIKKRVLEELQGELKKK